jgi:hypothetical protein
MYLHISRIAMRQIVITIIGINPGGLGVTTPRFLSGMWGGLTGPCIGGGAYWAGRSQARETFGLNGLRIELAHPTFWRKIIKLSAFSFSILC